MIEIGIASKKERMSSLTLECLLAELQNLVAQSGVVKGVPQERMTSVP